MVKLETFLDPVSLEGAIADGLVTEREHPQYPYSIFNYAAEVQWSREWNEITTQCRGLIVDRDTGEVLARPFRKFFNFTEVIPPKYVWGSPPVVYDKLDGSLGIGYECPDRYRIATRGSFESDQAQFANGWLQSTYPEWEPPEGITPLFEIIYPNNRIVLDYGDKCALVLIAAIETMTGADIPLWDVDWWPGEMVEQLTGWGQDIDSVYHNVHASKEENFEGVVAIWMRPGEPSWRFKIKTLDYVEKHRILTNLSSVGIWESMKSGTFHDLISSVPDEFYDWITEVQNSITSKIQWFREGAERDLNWALGVAKENGGEGDRATIAKYVKRTENPSLCFALLDGKDISEMLWKLVKPERTSPFGGKDDS